VARAVDFEMGVTDFAWCSVVRGELGWFRIEPRDGVAPMRSFDALRPGDRVRVRAVHGDELVYAVTRTALLARGDGWAVGPDPFGQGPQRLMTLTSGAEEGHLRVVWAAGDAP
jgi:hypothetical protein